VFRRTLLVLMVLVGSSSLLAAADPPRPSVLFMVADDLNCDLGCYGDPQVQSPNLDKLAKRGVRFEHAYCQFPLCSPSRSSFLTGRRPDETKVLTNPGARAANGGAGNTHPHFRDALPDAVSLPQLFRNNGYKVMRIGKLYHYGVPGQIGTDGLDDPPSWDRVINPKGRDKTDEERVFTLVPNQYGAVLSWLAADGEDSEQTDGITADTAVGALEEFSKSGEPFFLAVGFYRPHTPYVAPKKYFALYPPESIALPELSETDRERRPAPAYASAKKEQEELTDDLRRQAIQAYHASITFMDGQAGRVLDALDRLKLSDKTVVVFISDHGYHMGDHGLWQKMSLFERSSRVPLIIAAPSAGGNGHATESLAGLVDVYPTLADLCGLEASKDLDGKSLRPILNDPTAVVNKEVFTQVRRGQFDGYSVRTARWRFTEYDEGKKGRQLFDETNDPREVENLAENPLHADLVKELHETLTTYRTR
jgi:iduronate 2-sulfatase